MKRSTSLLTCPACCRRAFPSPHPIPSRPTTRTYTRPSTAPKPTLDMKHIRQNPGLYEENCINRNYKSKSRNSWQVLSLFEKWQQCQRQARSLREARNLNKKSLSGVGGTEAKRKELLEEARSIKEKLVDIEAEESRCEEEMEELALDLPNLSGQHTPIGDEPDVLEYLNEHPEPPGASSDRVWRSHVHIGPELDLLDFPSAATVSGWGWYFLKNEAALLEQALIQFSITQAMASGFNLVSPPSMVYEHMAIACGFAPRDQNGEQQIYAIEQAGKDKGKPRLVMAGTAEIPLAGMLSGQTVEERDLPIKYVGVNRCYRAEAGARGADTKGLYRVHEFTKVEMFAWAMPDSSTIGGEAVDPGVGSFTSMSPPPTHSTTTTQKETTSQADTIFTQMLSLQKSLLSQLGLHCRVLEQPSTDLGASATRKIDIEAFFPSRRTSKKDSEWGEVSSLSICTDYQTRRLATRVKLAKGGRLDFPWTLNGTALAVPRVIAAVLENGWDEERGAVRLPECLWGYMGGKKEIGGRKVMK